MTGDFIRDFIESYTARSFALCRLRPGEKRPTYRGWNLKGLSPDEVQPDDNVGISTGRLSGDLVCVDLDHPEVVQRADEFLPFTDMGDGRPGKPRSHRWYRVTDTPAELVSRNASGGIGGPWKKHFKRRKPKAALLDFLGTGA